MCGRHILLVHAHCPPLQHNNYIHNMVVCNEASHTEPFAICHISILFTALHSHRSFVRINKNLATGSVSQIHLRTSPRAFHPTPAPHDTCKLLPSLVQIISTWPTTFGHFSTVSLQGISVFRVFPVSCGNRKGLDIVWMWLKAFARYLFVLKNDRCELRVHNVAVENAITCSSNLSAIIVPEVCLTV